MEPILKQTQDPAPFAAIQTLLCLFWLVPMQGVSLFYSLKQIKPQFLWELTLLQAGLVAQVRSLHSEIYFQPKYFYRTRHSSEFVYVIAIK